MFKYIHLLIVCTCPSWRHAFYKHCCLLLCLSHLQAFAEASKELVIDCQNTPEVWADRSPPPFAKTNNLRRKVGSAKFARGQFINIVGRVLDSNCVPIDGASVRIWQANDIGFYHSQTVKLDQKDPNFTESGTAVTDNLGRYSFFTVMPGTDGDRAPHIKFSVVHHHFDLLETEMFFPFQLLNGRDKNFQHLLTSQQQRKLLLAKFVEYDSIAGADVYEFNITLEGKLKYKQY